ncbi:MAG: class I SAM-dependent methyltransferase family protein [Candidatus Bathyarchaeota archaeon]|nr:class I SAM-dependent methyltransferase family protein [Candidatus Bathyarchaeota archaeon]UCD26562.1 MAG: class I SAM-dependent methyltransferase family protein [Candidatus Bathyarchaeota archaeon]
MSETPSLKVPKALGEKAIRLARRLTIFNLNLKVQQVEDYLCIPLVRKPHPQEFRKFEKSLPEFEISAFEFEHAKRPVILVEVLKDKIPPHLLVSVPHAIDFVGDIAVVNIPPELADHKKDLGEAILNTHKRVDTVLAKSSAVEGVYRLRKFEVIAGVEKTGTIHREHGCVYHVDLARTYFSPRLSHEHDRVASQTKADETIVDMFTGVGPFSILIAKRHENAKVYAIDVNPDALEFLERNVAVNHVEKRVVPILGGARQVVKKRLVGVADRVIMNLPEKAIEYVDVGCATLKSRGGIMHYYEFTKAPDPIETAKIRLAEAVNRTSRSLKKILLAKVVRATAPFTWQVVVDAKIQ